MTLIGTQVGPYRITQLIGAGGMGEVYRAHDSRLGRDVAIKVLPPQVAGDPDRLVRFEFEARAAATLNHPNVTTIHDVLSYRDSPCIVMELLDGETLRSRLQRGAIPVRHGIEYAVQIANGLAAAHEHGIVHRDLKPENIFITTNDRAKILDFGIAKLRERPPDNRNATGMVTLPVNTQSGAVLGTVGYIAPEQLRGEAVDHRADVFAFGVVLYEMVRGRRPFEGKTEVDTLAAILTSEPPVPTLADDIPGPLDRIVYRCLRKEPSLRFQSAADLSFALDSLRTNPAAPHVVHTSRAARIMPWIAAGTMAAAAVALAVAGLFFARSGVTADSSPTVMASVVVPGALGLGASAGQIAVSPDGRWIAYSSKPRSQMPAIAIRSLMTGETRMVPDADGGMYPFWSSDSRTVGFYVYAQGLKASPLDGGQTVTLAQLAASSLWEGELGGSPSWHANGVVLVSSGNPRIIYSVRAGGALEPVTQLDTANGEVEHLSPVWLPDGIHFLYVSVGTKADRTAQNGIYIGATGSHERQRLIPGAGNAQYVDGFILFMDGPVLRAQRFDPDRQSLTGTPVRLVDEVALSGASIRPFGNHGAFTADRAGQLLAYVPGPRPLRTGLEWFDRTGTRLATVADDGVWSDVYLSPTAARATAIVATPDQDGNLFIFDASRGVRTRLTSRMNVTGGVWSPDEKRLAFAAERGPAHWDLYERPTDVTGDSRPLVEELSIKNPLSWSSDGRFLLYERSLSVSAPAELWVYSFTDGVSRSFLAGPFSQGAAKFSPDGRFVAYRSNASGRSEVYVATFPTPQHVVRVSSNGGNWPQWRQDGKELFYAAADNTLMSAEISTRNGTPVVLGSRPLFKARLTSAGDHPFDAAPDGGRFLLATGIVDDEATSVTLITNWRRLLSAAPNGDGH